MDHPALRPYGWTDRWAAALRAVAPTIDVPGGDALRPGRVVRHDGVAVMVVTDDGVQPVHLGPRLDPAPVVGDWVAFGAGVVWAVLERTSLLRRRDPRADIEQPLVANVDVVVIVCGLDRPVKSGRVQRAVTLARDAGAEPMVVLTKADTDPNAADIAATVRAASPGVEVLVTSSRTGDGVERVAEVARGRTIVLLGESGAGKSTLTNALMGHDVAETAEVRSGDAKGRHTTTTRAIHLLPTGGVLVDTPGIRAVGLWAEADSVAATFDDLEALALTCRFADCEHRSEPGCAVRPAVASGEISAERLAQWRQLNEEALAMERQAELRAQAQAQATSRAGRSRGPGRRRR